MSMSQNRTIYDRHVPIDDRFASTMSITYLDVCEDISSCLTVPLDVPSSL